jgi:alkyldihydroxyacetonephosphate synthase
MRSKARAGRPLDLDVVRGIHRAGTFVLMTQPTPPIELTGLGERLRGRRAEIPDGFLGSLADVCPVVTDAGATADASRDWWPLALRWALDGEVPRRADALARPESTDQVAALLARCSERAVPVTVAGGRSGVCGATVPVFGGVVLDTTGLSGIVEVDDVSGVVGVRSGTFGPDLESSLRQQHQLTIGHFPQSFDLATVGGWVACRGAGQYSTRYGKVEQMVVGLEAVLADGTVIRTGGAPAASTGPDLTQLLLGSEGMLAVITTVWLKTHPLPAAERRASFWFGALDDGFEACRQILRRGATPAVLRLYDAQESARSHGGDGTQCVLLVLDEGDPLIVDATMAVVADACRHGASGSPSLVDGWFEHRNDTSALQALTRQGYVVDTMEVAAPWSRLSDVVAATTSAQLAVPHVLASTCHLSHSYLDGACLYFTFAAAPPPDQFETTSVALWDEGQRAALDAGANLSHHHGVGLNRARFAAGALGDGHRVLAAIKAALDPAGILNPGKFGLASPFGEVGWP